MSDYVTVAELRTALGVGEALYSDADLQEVCTSAQSAIEPMLWQDERFISGWGISENKLKLAFALNHNFYVGHSVDVSGVRSDLDATYTLDSVAPLYVGVLTTGKSDVPQHTQSPMGRVRTHSPIDYSTNAQVRLAALMVASDMWQARQGSSGGAASPDFTPSPYKMGNTLLARVRGLLINVISPYAVVG